MVVDFERASFKVSQEGRLAGIKGREARSRWRLRDANGIGRERKRAEWDMDGGEGAKKRMRWAEDRGDENGTGGVEVE